jgi:hypothetical protein
MREEREENLTPHKKKGTSAKIAKKPITGGEKKLPLRALRGFSSRPSRLRAFLFPQ